MNRKIGTFLAALTLLGVALALPGAASAESVAFGTDWKAEAEHGGFYQAIATGIYKRYGLDVTLRPGGPQVNHAQLLAAGVLDFNIASNSFVPLNFVREQIPMVAVAAIFEKDPSVLIAHPGQGDDSLAALKGRPIMISGDTRVHPVVLLLADAGYGSYGALIETSEKLVRDKPDLVQRFVDASIEGWYSYLQGDPAPGNALIKHDNPEMTDALIAYGMEKMKAYGIVDSGEAKQNGIGAMSEARWRDFFDTVVKAGLYPAEMDFRKAYTLQFVNKKVGLAPGSK